MIIKYKSCDKSIVEEKIDSVKFYGILFDNSIELECQRSKDNPHYDLNDGFKGRFYITPSEVEEIKI